MKTLVYGVGINDADYVIKPTINGKQVNCPYYQRWVSVLKRCYSEKYLKMHPTYIGCEISEEWKIFSNFKAWMETQDWVGADLDKDILFPDNKLYSKDTCVFVTQNLNKFLTDSGATRGEYMIGVYWNKKAEKFHAKCRDGSDKRVNLGFFNTELEAHLAWKDCKHKLACKLAEDQSDSRVAEALRKRFV